MSLNKIKSDLKEVTNKKEAKILTRFFKTGKGEYGEGDIFLGVTVPEQRKIAKKYYNLNLKEIKKLLESKIHEERQTSLFILIANYEKAQKENNTKKQKEIFNFYLNNSEHVNNWDLVDLSAPKIVGEYLLNKKEKRKVLYELAISNNLWKKRIAILSTYTFIKNKDFKDTIKLSEMFLKEKHDLMHKAVGWMLREVGKKDEKILIDFLDKHYKEMPRTMLRYAIEKFPEEKRKYYLNLK